MVDIRSVNGSLFLCMVRLFNQVYSSANMTFPQLLSSMNDTDAQRLLECDKDNRPHQQYWLVYSRLQIGQYQTSLQAYSDLVLSYNRSGSNFYIPYAYRGRGHLATETLFWFLWRNDYRDRYRLVFQDLMAIDSRPIELLINGTYNVEGYYLEWSEAAVRLGKCLIH